MLNIVNDLRLLESGARWVDASAADTLERAADEIERLQAEVASLRITLGGRTFGPNIPEPIGCPAPGACAQVAEIGRLRNIIDTIHPQMQATIDRLTKDNADLAAACNEGWDQARKRQDQIRNLEAERDEALSDWRAEMDMHRDEHQRRMRAEAERNVERANAETLDAICRRTEAERDEAVATLALYRAENGCTRGQRTTQWCGEATKLRERLLQVNAGLLRVMQYEQKCDQTGQPCRSPDRCACSLEAETWCGGGGT